MQLWWGNAFGIQTTNAQPMKIAATEALWNTQQPASFSLFQIGGFTKSDQTPSFSIEIPGLLSYLATGSFQGKVVGLNQNQEKQVAQHGPGNYMPQVELEYWCMRVMAYLGGLMLLIALWGGWLLWRKKLEQAKWFQRTATGAIVVPFLACFGGWILTETGRQPWIVYGLQKTADAVSPSSTTTKVAFSLGVFLALYTGARDRRLLSDAPLRTARSARDRRRRGRSGARPGAQLLMQTAWFWILFVLWSLYFVTEGFDFGVGMLLPILGRSEDDRRTMIQSIGPVWDGNEVWLVIAGAATFAAFPAWYATMFSGFYVALLLLLVFLITRIVSFEWRGKAESAAWRGFWTWVNAIASLAIPLIWGIALSSLLHGVPISSAQEYTGTFWDLFTPYTVVAGLAFVLLFALHGAVYLGLRTSGDLRARAGQWAALLAVPAALGGAAFLIWTLVVGIDKNDKSVFPGIVVVVLAAAAALAAVVLTRRRREGAAFVATAATIVLAVATLFTALVSPRDGLIDELRRQPHHDELLVGPLHTRRDQHLHARPAAGHPALPELGLPRLPRATRPGETGVEPRRVAGSKRREEPTT